MGGEDRVKALIELFYNLMDLEPTYAALRAVHESTLDTARKADWSDLMQGRLV